MAGSNTTRLRGALCLLACVVLAVAAPVAGAVAVSVVGAAAVPVAEAVAVPVAEVPAPAPPFSPTPAVCLALSVPIDPPVYYGFPIVSTRRLPGTGQATGAGLITFVPSPFGLALAADGSYVYDLILASERLAPPREGVYVAWVTTPSLDRVRLVGALDEQGAIRGTVQWNKFLVVITLEPRLDPEATTWSGPIVMRGMSRSGMMHTMAGHGPFETENCALYGY